MHHRLAVNAGGDWLKPGSPLLHNAAIFSHPICSRFMGQPDRHGSKKNCLWNRRNCGVFRITLIAAGVEPAGGYQTQVDLEVRYTQGYLIARPGSVLFPCRWRLCVGWRQSHNRAGFSVGLARTVQQPLPIPQSKGRCIEPRLVLINYRCCGEARPS